VASKRAAVEERLHAVVELGKRAPATLAIDLRPFLRDKAGIVAAAAATIAAGQELHALEKELEETFTRFLVDPLKTDPGCRAKLAAADALRKLDARAPDVYVRGVAVRQLEPTFGPPIDTAAPVRVCCAAALLETRHPLALLEVAPLLADPEPIKEADDEAVRLALLAMGESRDERALPALREYAESAPDKEARTTVLLALSISRMPAANEYLLQLVENAPERRALEALAALQSQRFDAALIERLRAVAIARGGSVSDAFVAMTNRK